MFDNDKVLTDQIRQRRDTQSEMRKLKDNLNRIEYEVTERLVKQNLTCYLKVDWARLERDNG